MSAVFARDPNVRQKVSPNQVTIQKVKIFIVDIYHSNNNFEYNTYYFCKLLDDNAALIQTIVEYQNLGRVQEATEYIKNNCP